MNYVPTVWGLLREFREDDFLKTLATASEVRGISDIRDMHK